jgi:hypothetical protein
MAVESFQIYNDGIPSLMPLGAGIIRGISDEAIDECYPPTAEEVAELEAVEAFVEALAEFEMMEEMQEQLGEDFDKFFARRWTARRELLGKPKKARSEPVLMIHGKSKHMTEDELKIVVHDRKQRNFGFEKMEHHHSHKDDIASKHQVMRSNVKLNGKITSRTIQQPRKGN